MFRKIIKELLGWGSAIIVAVIVLNAFTFCFYHPVHELERFGGSTPGLMVPHQWGLYGTEGWGIQTIDSLGYPNPDIPREQSYYCIIGASHTEGFQSKMGERYSDILNKRLGYSNSLKFYNIAHSGFYFDGIAKRFKGIVEEFPNMQGLVIEISTTNYSADALNYALDQIGYEEDRDSVNALMSKLNPKDKAIISFKNYFPFFRVLTQQRAAYYQYKRNKTSKGLQEDESAFNIDEYKEALSEVMSLIRTEYKGDILIVYHPMTELNADGTLRVNYSKSDEVFKQVCDKNSIGFINMAADFEKAFYNDGHAAYGFWNTTYMSGHMNHCAHQLIADRIYEYFYER